MRWPRDGRPGRRVLLDRHRRLHRREQGPGRTGRPVHGRLHGGRRPPLERRQRPGPQPPPHLRATPQGDPRRLVHRRGRARTPRTGRTWPAWNAWTPAGPRPCRPFPPAARRLPSHSSARSPFTDPPTWLRQDGAPAPCDRDEFAERGHPWSEIVDEFRHRGRRLPPALHARRRRGPHGRQLLPHRPARRPPPGGRASRPPTSRSPTRPPSSRRTRAWWRPS